MPVALGFQSAIARTTFRRFSVSLPHSLRTPGKRPTNTRGSRRILENLCLRVVFESSSSRLQAAEANNNSPRQFPGNMARSSKESERCVRSAGWNTIETSQANYALYTHIIEQGLYDREAKLLPPVHCKFAPSETFPFSIWSGTLCRFRYSNTPEHWA